MAMDPYAASVLVFIGAFALLLLFVYLAFFARIRESLRFMLLMFIVAMTAALVPSIHIIVGVAPAYVVRYQWNVTVPYTTVTTAIDQTTTTITTATTVYTVVPATVESTVYTYYPQAAMASTGLTAVLAIMVILLMVYVMYALHKVVTGRWR